MFCLQQDVLFFLYVVKNEIGITHYAILSCSKSHPVKNQRFIIPNHPVYPELKTKGDKWPEVQQTVLLQEPTAATAMIICLC